MLSVLLLHGARLEENFQERNEHWLERGGLEQGDNFYDLAGHFISSVLYKGSMKSFRAVIDNW